WNSASHRFNNRKAKPLVQGRIEKHLRGVVEEWHVFSGKEPRQQNVVLHLQLANASQYRFEKRILPSSQNKLVRQSRPPNLCECIDNSCQIFPCLQSSEIEDEFPSNPVLSPKLFPGFPFITRSELLPGAFIGDGNLVLWNAVSLNDVALRVFRNRDDVIGPVSGIPDEPPQPGAFTTRKRLRKVFVSNIWNCGDGFAFEKRWNDMLCMEYIQPVFPSAPGN